MYETAGKLKWIGTTQSFASGFTKREFVVTTAADKYPQDLKFGVVKDKCPLLDPFELGQDVQVSFDIRGNEYNGKYFVNLSCWKIHAVGAASGTSSAASPPASRDRAAASTEPDMAEISNEDDFNGEPPF